MENNTLVRCAAIVILIPVVAGAAIGAVKVGAIGINAINRARFNRKMRKGIKEGTIVQIDGQYYTVEQG